MRLGGTIMLGLGILFLLIAIGFGGSVLWFRTHAVRVTGTVIAEVLTPYADGNMYCPTIRYTTREGQSLTHDSNVCAWPPAYEEGQRVTVYYDRLNPKDVQMADLFGNWFIPGLFGFLGITFTISGVGMFSPGPIITRLLKRISFRPASGNGK